ncbi:BRCT domain-containing protein [Mycena sp. CBHHK59/15]|nr:BRCT domain-containing protein [Mycena sp. CBHHK59/15]
MLLFDSVKYHLPETLPRKRCADIIHVLESNGGERAASINTATHIITNSSRFEGWQDIEESVAIVNDIWVDRAMILGQLHPCQFYSAEPAMVFSGVVACASGVSPYDLSVLRAGVTALGGQWRNGLTKDVTHLLANTPNSVKYATALEHQQKTHIKLLLPHWFDDAVRLGTSMLPTVPYEWPDPTLLLPPPEVEGKKQKTENTARKLSDEKRAFYKTAIWDPDKGGPFPGPPEPVWDKVWGGRKVLLSPTLGLVGDRRRVVKQAVEAAGGSIIEYASNNGDGDEEEEIERVWECNVLVTRWRTGQAFFKAVVEGKIVGTLNWLLNVHTTGTLSSPMDQLLHYPVRKIPIENFSSHEITVTNYTGEARDYIKRLIHSMGAKFTPSMTGQNTVLIAAHMGGTKTAKALSWSIPVVHHTWLEDCFVQWRRLTVGVPKYIDFPPNLDFAPMLAERGVALTLEDLGAEEEEDIIAREKAANGRPPVGTEASAREVEGILGDGDVIIGDDEGGRRTRMQRPLSRRGRVSASISPTKQKAADEVSATEEPAVQPWKTSRRPPRRVASDEDVPPTILKSASRHAPKEADGDEQMEDVETAIVGKRAKAKVTKKKRGANGNAAGQEVQSETEAVRMAISSKAKGKEKAPKTNDKVVEPEEVDCEVEAAKSAKLKGKGKEKDKTKGANGSKVMFATDDDSAGPSTRLPKKPKPHGPSTASAKRKAQAIESASSADEDQEPDCPPPRKRTKSDNVPAATSSNTAKEATISNHVSSRPPVKWKMTAGPGRDSASSRVPMTRTESLRVLADERTSSAGGSRTKKTPAASGRMSPPPSPIANPAAKAQQKKPAVTKLASRNETGQDGDEMMSDVVNYELEGKTHRSRTSMGKEKDGADEPPPPVVVKSKTKPKKNGATANTSSGSRASRKSTDSSIKLMTTTISLSNHVQKILSKLGVKVTTQVTECTHLIAPNVVRTEKFLCALGLGAFILSDRWAIESAAANKLLPEDDFILHDKAIERKWDIRLVDSMARAKELGGKLFENITFYATPNASPNLSTLKGVVTTLGGKWMTQTPTMRILNSTPGRYVISCPEDISIWRPLTQHHTIYSSELLLNAAMKQKIDWDNAAFHVSA